MWREDFMNGAPILLMFDACLPAALEIVFLVLGPAAPKTTRIDCVVHVQAEPNPAHTSLSWNKNVISEHDARSEMNYEPRRFVRVWTFLMALLAVCVLCHRKQQPGGSDFASDSPMECAHRWKKGLKELKLRWVSLTLITCETRSRWSTRLSHMHDASTGSTSSSCSQTSIPTKNKIIFSFGRFFSSDRPTGNNKRNEKKNRNSHFSSRARFYEIFCEIMAHKIFYEPESGGFEGLRDRFSLALRCLPPLLHLFFRFLIWNLNKNSFGCVGVPSFHFFPKDDCQTSSKTFCDVSS